MVVIDDPDDGFVTNLADLARRLHSAANSEHPDPTRVLSEVTERAVTLLPGVDHAGISLVQRKNSRVTVASTAQTDEVAELLDKLQEAADDGPCLDAIREHRSVRVDDVVVEDRWPMFIAATREQTSVRSSLSIQLYVETDDQGALNLYSTKPNTFSDELVTQALALGAHAAVGLSEVRRSEQFKAALSSRDIIGQAKGMIMERYKIDEHQAFGLLKRLSQDHNIPLADIARQLVAAESPDKPQS